VQAGSLLMLLSGGLLLLAGVLNVFLFFSVVQDGLRERRVSVDEGHLALRGAFSRYTRIYLALLTAEERRLPRNRWVAGLQWLLPVLGVLLAAGVIFNFWHTGHQ